MEFALVDVVELAHAVLLYVTIGHTILGKVGEPAGHQLVDNCFFVLFHVAKITFFIDLAVSGPELTEEYESNCERMS